MMSSKRVFLYGLSGSGKSTAARVLEDNGFRVLRNLPQFLLEESFKCSESSRIAVFPEINAQEDIISTPVGVLEIFLEASDETLLNRYKESRRPHPFERGAGIIDAIRLERDILAQVRTRATHVIATDHLKPAQFASVLTDKLEANSTRKLVVTFLSFGFKYGVPSEIDLCFDVRFLPNPFFVEELKAGSGEDEPVKRFVLEKTETNVFLEKFKDFFSFLLPCYAKEGKNYLTVGIGCTGGRHRSVAIANALAKLTEGQNVQILCLHRDIERDLSR